MSRGGDGAVGMMDTAYFVGRGELLDFFNGLLGLQLSKIEQTASGAVACQLTDYIYPGSIPMSRVNWEARSDYEFVGNYKLLQAAFTRHNVKRYVDVDRLIRAKYQDNLEFCQWLKAFFDQSGAQRDDYDPIAVRSRGKGGKGYNQLLSKTAGRHGSKPLPAGRRPTASSPTKRAPAARTTLAERSAAASRPAPAAASRPNSRTATASRPANRTTPTKPAVADVALKKKNSELNQKVLDLETSIVELEKERDFYFKKLRDVEFLLQIRQDRGIEGADVDNVVGDIFKVLYATAEEEIGVSEDGEIIQDIDGIDAELEGLEGLGEQVATAKPPADVLAEGPADAPVSIVDNPAAVAALDVLENALADADAADDAIDDILAEPPAVPDEF